MENIVKIDEIRDCVAKTLRGISEGILDARDFGMNAEFPENGEIQFRMTVVKDFQTLAVAKVESGEQNETQGGTTRETQTGTSKETRTGTSKEMQNGTTEQEQNETRDSVESGTTEEKTERKEDGTSGSNNGHDQVTITEYTNGPAS